MDCVAGYTAHVMTFEVGAVLEDPNWQAPVYCFGKDKPLLESMVVPTTASSLGKLIRDVSNVSISL